MLVGPSFFPPPPDDQLLVAEETTDVRPPKAKCLPPWKGAFSVLEDIKIMSMYQGTVTHAKRQKGLQNLALEIQKDTRHIQNRYYNRLQEVCNNPATFKKFLEVADSSMHFAKLVGKEWEFFPGKGMTICEEKAPQALPQAVAIEEDEEEGEEMLKSIANTAMQEEPQTVPSNDDVKNNSSKVMDPAKVSGPKSQGTDTEDNGSWLVEYTPYQLMGDLLRQIRRVLEILIHKIVDDTGMVEIRRRRLLKDRDFLENAKFWIDEGDMLTLALNLAPDRYFVDDLKRIKFYRNEWAHEKGKHQFAEHELKDAFTRALWMVNYTKCDEIKDQREWVIDTIKSLNKKYRFNIVL